MIDQYAQLKEALKPLNKINPKRVYTELLATAIIAWGFFVLALNTTSMWSIVMSGFVSMVFSYRGLSFIHEVSHYDKELKWLAPLFNALFGYPHKVPAYTMKTHRHHHSILTFSQMADPEYENWTVRPKIYLARPFILSFFYPLFLTLRFGFWPLVLLVAPKSWTMATYRSASTFVMNLKYVRPFSEDDFQDMKKQDLASFLYFIALAVILLNFSLLGKAFALWYVQITIISIMNTYRALVAHRYTIHRTGQQDVEGQLKDSVTIEGSFLTEIWAPIGLRYHSTHHLFPKIPYYNLKKAHNIIKSMVHPKHHYRETIEPNFISAFSKLFHACR